MDSSTISVEIVSQVTAEVEEAFHLLLPQLSQSAPTLTRERLEQIFATSTNTLFIARRTSSENIIGALTLVVMSIPSGTRAWIEDVVVDSSARGGGVGDALISAAVTHARASGARTLDLTSNPTRTAAHRLYEKAGFVMRDTRVYRYSLK